MTTRAQKEESSAAIETPASGAGAAWVVQRPVRRSTRCSGIVGVSSCYGKRRAAPGGQLAELSWRRQAHIAGDVQLHAGREGNPAPDGALGGRRRLRVLAASRSLTQALADLVEGPAVFL